jgi:catechol 2,3-dioxygenase
MFDRLGAVRYRTPNLDPQVKFYRDVLGFTLRSRTETQAVLGAPDRDLVVLDLVPRARRVDKTTGLYHTAFLFPTHRDLVHLLGRIATARTPVEGFNHHGTHEAIYLPDADGNGVELAWDLPEDQWPREGKTIDFQRHDKTFDPQAVLDEFQADRQPWGGIPAHSRVGHVHLHMGDFAATQAFYTEALGLDVMMASAQHGMLFLAADGYHHHVGNNLWKGKNLPPAPEDAIGLVEYTLKLDAGALPEVKKRLETRGHRVEDREDGWFVKDASGIGIALSAV